MIEKLMQALGLRREVVAGGTSPIISPRVPVKPYIFPAFSLELEGRESIKFHDDCIRTRRVLSNLGINPQPSMKGDVNPLFEYFINSFGTLDSAVKENLWFYAHKLETCQLAHDEDLARRVARECGGLPLIIFAGLRGSQLPGDCTDFEGSAEIIERFKQEGYEGKSVIMTKLGEDFARNRLKKLLKTKYNPDEYIFTDYQFWPEGEELAEPINYNLELQRRKEMLIKVNGSEPLVRIADLSVP